MSIPPKVNGSRSPTPQPRQVLQIVDYVRSNGFPEKAALLEQDVKGVAKLRLFGLSATVVVEGIPFSPVKRRGHWSFMGAQKRPGKVA